MGSLNFRDCRAWTVSSSLNKLIATSGDVDLEKNKSLETEESTEGVFIGTNINILCFV